jgi:hypothetical protein
MYLPGDLTSPPSIAITMKLLILWSSTEEYWRARNMSICVVLIRVRLSQTELWPCHQLNGIGTRQRKCETICLTSQL